MNLLRPIHVAALVGGLTCVFAACSSEHGSSATSGAGGASDSVGMTVAVASSGVGGNEAPDASLVDVMDFCTGDVSLWANLTGAPTPCQSGPECCVITSECLAQAQVVGVDHKGEASAAWPHCDLECIDCFAPAIEVACVAGICRGRVVAGAAPDSPLRQDHCGNDVKFIDFSGPVGLHFYCGG